MKVRITNIQRFSLQDGPGIRTTVFFKGCNLRCPWCANPENINYEIQEYMDENTKKIFGYDIELKELEKEILKDENYYKLNNGGVTFSGGEPLLQFNKIEELLNTIQNDMFEDCKKRNLEKTTIATNMEEFEKNINENQGFIKAMWCGDEECENKIKELTGAHSRCMPFEEEHVHDKCVCCGKPAKHYVIWGRQY